ASESVIFSHWKEWTEFETSCALLSKDLETLAASIPSVDLVEETEERLVERISLFQRIQHSLEEKRACVYHVLSDGKRLLSHVSCPDLSTQVQRLEGYQSLTSRVSHQLQHHQTLLQHWTRLQQEAGTLAEWLGSALGRVQAWEQQAVSVPEDLASIHSRLRLVIEFWREVAVNATLKTSVVTTGRQLLRLKRADGRALRARLASYEQQWAELLNRLLDVQHQLHQLQMEWVPSRQAMAELSKWLCGLAAEMAQGEERLRAVSGSESVRKLIQRHKVSARGQRDRVRPGTKGQSL
uniref:Uncharacterized protein n=1 Tax=Callorhinchus milii TaxID=7868 RepID=A0A4W3H9J8_CALMI